MRTHFGLSQFISDVTAVDCGRVEAERLRKTATESGYGFGFEGFLA